MRLVIECGELSRALGRVTSVVERRTTIPILSNVLLRARDSKLEFKATDLEREVIEGVPGDISAPGAVTVPAHMLHDIVRKLPKGAQVDIRKEGDKEQLTLASGQARFALQTLPAEDFPDIGSGEMSQQFELSEKDLKRLIDKTRFAISTEETRYYLNGIYLHTAQSNKKATLRAVATDGHRLAQVELPLPRGAQGMPGIIIPRKTVHELHRLIEDFLGQREGRRQPGESTLRDRQRNADLRADRRDLPGLRARHPAVERQGDEGLQRGVHGCGRPCVDDCERARARGEARHQARQARALGQQPGGR